MRVGEAAAMALAALANFLLAAAPLRVVDAQGKPLPGARFEVLERREGRGRLAAMLPPYAVGETDSEGRLPLSLPRREGLLVLIDHPLFLPRAEPQPSDGAATLITLQAGKTWRGSIELPKREIRKGRICAHWEEQFAPWRELRTWKRCAEVSPQGGFELTGLAGGEVVLEVQAPGFLLLQKRTVVPPAGTLRLDSGIQVRGRIIGPGPETPIHLARVSTEGSSPVETLADGTFAIAVPALPATLDVSAPGFRRQQIATGKTLRKKGLLIRLERGEQVRGALIDEERRAVERAVFWIEQQSPGRSRSESRKVETREGAFTLDLPAPGLYRIRIQAEGFKDEPVPEISVALGESHPLGSIVMRRGSGVAGAVVDAVTRTPLEGAEVEVLPAGASLLNAVAHQRVARGVTGEDGRFRISGLATGRFAMTVRRTGYAPALQTESLEGDVIRDVGEILLGKGVLVRGTVRDREGQPRPGLAVRVLDREQSSLLPIAELATDSEGRFEGPRLAAGRYRLQLRGSRLLLDQEIEIPEGQDEWPLELTAGGARVSGLVTRGGVPVTGGSLSLSSILDPAQGRGKILFSAPEADSGSFAYGFPESRLAATVGPDGTFELADVPEGSLSATYSGDAGSVTRRVVVPAAARFKLDLEVGGVALRGQVVAAGEETGIEALVRVTNPDSGEPAAVEATDGEGHYSITDLQPGRYTVQAGADGYETRVVSGVEVREGAPPLRISLKPGGDGGIRLRLRYPDGTPASWVPVTLLDASGAPVQSLPTNGNGEREFANVPSGRYWLVWTDSFAGAGASELIDLVAGQSRTIARGLSEGGSLEIACRLERCAGLKIDYVSILSASGAEIGSQISGASPALRFSSAGAVSLGRLSPGNYRLRLWAGGETWSRSFALDAGGATVEVP